MTWAKIDDGWWCHPKVMGLSLAASGLWARALSWSCQQRTDIIPDRFLPVVSATFDDADELVQAGLWIEVEGGYRIHDWAEYQDRSLSEMRAEAGRKGGLAAAQAREAKSVANPEANDQQPPSNPEAKTRTDQHEHPNPEVAKGKQTGVASAANGLAGALPGPTRPGPTEPKSNSLSTDVDRETDAGFDEFWNAYPPRKGKKVGKAAALVEWHKLTGPQRDRALIGARNLAASDQLPKDAERFLRRGKGNARAFDDWQEPAAPDPPATPATHHVSEFPDGVRRF